MQAAYQVIEYHHANVRSNVKASDYSWYLSVALVGVVAVQCCRAEIRHLRAQTYTQADPYRPMYESLYASWNKLHAKSGTRVKGL